jgi:hypothetical protein
MPDNVAIMAVMQDAFKNYLLPGIVDQMEYGSSAFYAQLERNTESVVGKDIQMVMGYGRSGGIGAITEAGNFPVPNPRKFKRAIWETKDLAVHFQISDKSIEASKSSVGAFANMLEKMFADHETDAKFYIGRSVLGDGSGKLGTIDSATWNATPKTLTLVMDDEGTPMLYLSEGMLVDIFDVSGSAVLAGGSCLEVISVDDDTRTVVLRGLLADLTDIASTIASGDFLVSQSSYGNELTGLGAVFDNSRPIYGLSRTDYPWLKSQIVDSVGEISDMVIQKLIDKVEARTGSRINFLQCSQGVGRAYIEYKAAARQTVNSMEITGGWEAMTYVNGGKKIPIVTDRFLPEGVLDGLDTKDFALYAMNDWHWRDKDGGVLYRVDNRPAWGAQIIRFCDLGCQRPAGQFRASGITES